jgi:hypothetical protein
MVKQLIFVYVQAGCVKTHPRERWGKALTAISLFWTCFVSQLEKAKTSRFLAATYFDLQI